MRILDSVYNDLIMKIPAAPPEMGGLVGGKHDIIDRYELISGENSKSEALFIPDVEISNSILTSWQNNEIVFWGIFHSHPDCCPCLSYQDKDYAERILKAVDFYTNSLYFPIVLPGREIIFHKASLKNGEIFFEIDKLERW